MVLRRKPAARSRAAAWLAAVAVTGALVAVPAAAAGAAPPPAVTATELTFQAGDRTVPATLTIPADATGPVPGIVLVAGSGDHPRTDLAEQARAFARHGIAALTYDKRTEGYSQSRRDYQALADDALAAFDALRRRPEVDPTQAGIHGHSEGGWVTPLAAARSADVTFLIVTGASGVPPARQQSWAYGNYLRHSGVSGSMLRAVPVTVVRLLVDGGVFPEADHDPAPTLERIRQPVLGLWGAHDRLSPPAETMRIYRDALDRGGNRNYTLRVVPDAQHALFRTPDGGFTRGDGLHPRYPEIASEWIKALPTRGASVHVDPAPKQLHDSVELRPMAWYESVTAQLVALVVLLVGFAGYLVATLVGRIRRGDRTGGQRAALVASGAGLATVLGLLGYFGYLMGAGMGKLAYLSPVLAGRHLPWLALQLLAVVTVVAAVVLVRARWRARRERGGRVRTAFALTAGVVFVPWALSWGLLLP